MNAERLREVIDQLLDAESRHPIQNSVTQVRDHLQQLVQNPQQPSFQTPLAAALDQARSNMKEFLGSFTPADMKAFQEIRATEAFASDILTHIDRSIQQNPITPQVALNAINELLGKRNAYLTALRELQNRLREIGVEREKIEPGQVEIGILIPRNLFQNHLSEMINELRVINRVIRAFSEVATGAPEPVEVRQISTSEPLFIFGISACTIAMFGKVVKWALDTWKQVEEIRRLRMDAQKIEAFTEKEIKDTFDGKIEESVKAAIDQQVKELLPPSAADTGRQHELRTDLAWALDSVLTRVERGMTVEIRFLPPATAAGAEEAGEDAEGKAFGALKEVAPQLSFPPPEAAPIRPLPPPKPPAR